jgi:hypothetical protein
MTWILETSPSYAFVFLRLGLAVTFFFHSTQQIFGWHGGRGLKAHLANWRDRQGIPTPIGALGLFIEFFGSLALLTGFSRGHSHWGWPFSSVSQCSNLMCGTDFSWRAVRESTAA